MKVKLLRIFLVTIIAAIFIVLAYRQSQRWKIGATPVLVVNKQKLFEGTPVQIGDVRLKKVLNDRIPPNALTNINQALNRKLVREKQRGTVLIAQDLQPTSGRSPTNAIKLNTLIPEGRLLASLKVKQGSVALQSLDRGDRFDIIAIDSKGTPNIIARDAFYVGSLTGGTRVGKSSEPKNILGQEIPPPPSAVVSDPASAYVVLKLALWPKDVLPVASASGSNARISLILHGKKEQESGKALSIDPPKKVEVPKMPVPVPVVIPIDPLAELKKDLRRIDPRIRIKRIHVNNETEGTKEAYVLTGSVRNMQRLEKAMLLTELFLGEPSSAIKPLRDAAGIQALSSNFRGGGNRAGNSNLSKIKPQSQSVGAYLARGLILTNASGRVISFLEVDELHQILVSIRVLEIDRNKADRKGIAYRVDGEHFSIGQHLFQEALPNNFGSVANITNVGNLAGSFVDSSTAVFAAIEFLEENGVARSVAEPNILTLSGEVASVLVGGSVPIPSTSLREEDVFNSFDFQEFGVELNIRPTLDEEDIVTLEVAPRIVNVDNNISVEGVPGFEAQEVRTIARVRQSESLLLGGLLSYKETKDGRKIPFFGDIPILGNMFRWKGRSFEEKELLFLITPVLNTDSVEGLSQKVELPGLEFRDAKLGEAPPPYSINDEGLPLSWEEHYDQGYLQQLKHGQTTPIQRQGVPVYRGVSDQMKRDEAARLIWRDEAITIEPTPAVPIWDQPYSPTYYWRRERQPRNRDNSY